jgi:hypothetical protein
MLIQKQLLCSKRGKHYKNREISMKSGIPQRERQRLSKNTLVLYVTQVTSRRSSRSLDYGKDSHKSRSAGMLRPNRCK